MRLPLLVFLALFPVPLAAETIEAPSRVVSVTLYPWGASVVRLVEFDAPAGVHELIVPDLPQGIPVGSLRVVPEAALKVGAVTLATGRLPAGEVAPSAEVAAAEDEVERLEAVLRAREAAIAAIRLRVDAANESWTFLRGLGQNEGIAALDADRLRELTRLVGEETLAARQAAHAAEKEAAEAERAKADDVEALDEARRALAALVAEGDGRAVLTLAVEAAAAGAASLELTTFTDRAGWRPVYDLRLTRDATPTLAIERSVFVAQASGEDWRGVDLVLSTARPDERSAPSEVYPWLRRIGEEDQRKLRATMEMEEMTADSIAGYAGALAAPEPVMEAATAEYQGMTVVYRYQGAVDIRDGVEDLRLTLDTLTLTPEVYAAAVPGQDASAFLVADLVNETGEALLPGQAMLFLDGAMVGESHLPLIAAGADQKLGFGAIDGIRLTRTVPDRSEGERGLLTSRNQLDEVAVLKFENLTGEAWPMRVLDRVPYSEQDDLEITHNAVPPATETDVDGQRGVLAWEFDLGAGEMREITLSHSLRWPEGYVLQ